jgi:hypothetical protein
MTPCASWHREKTGSGSPRSWRRSAAGQRRSGTSGCGYGDRASSSRWDCGSIPPHWFRDAAATSIAIEDPVHVRDAHLLLGNTLAVMEKHYNQAQSLEASRRHHAMLATLRASLKPSDT